MTDQMRRSLTHLLSLIALELDNDRDPPQPPRRLHGAEAAAAERAQLRRKREQRKKALGG